VFGRPGVAVRVAPRKPQPAEGALARPDSIRARHALGGGRIPCSAGEAQRGRAQGHPYTTSEGPRREAPGFRRGLFRRRLLCPPVGLTAAGPLARATQDGQTGARLTRQADAAAHEDRGKKPDVATAGR